MYMLVTLAQRRGKGHVIIALVSYCSNPFSRFAGCTLAGLPACVIDDDRDTRAALACTELDEDPFVKAPRRTEGGLSKPTRLGSLSEAAAVTPSGWLAPTVALTAALSRTFTESATSCPPPNEVPPSPTTLGDDGLDEAHLVENV
ncbi:hypothetical protein DL769_004597 [Monosporascus sp. CRB-8-3]|nr:hypothetical protein DL769_004597 [Monosporascus sp. CRB-8-3]